MAKKKTLEEKLADALNEAEGGLLAGAKSEDLDGDKAGKNAASKESKASFPTATTGDSTTGKLAGADAAELDPTKRTGDKEKAGLPDGKGAGNSEAGYTEFTAPEKLKLKEQIESLLGEELSLSEDFKDKAAGLFESAVIARSNQAIIDYKETLQEQFDNELKQAIDSISEQVDAYVTYAAKQWTEDNKVAIEKGIRTELAESFISGMHTLFTEHYITVPESKENLVESLTEKVETLTEQYNQSIKATMLKEQEISELKKSIALNSLTEGMAESEIDKLKQLAEGIDFKDDEDYAAKINQIRENYFDKAAVKPRQLSEDKKIVGTDPLVTIKESNIQDRVAQVMMGMNSFNNKQRK